VKGFVPLKSKRTQWSLSCGFGIGTNFAVVFLMYAMAPFGLGVSIDAKDAARIAEAFFVAVAATLAVRDLVARRDQKSRSDRAATSWLQTIPLVLGAIMVAFHKYLAAASTISSLAMGIVGAAALGISEGLSLVALTKPLTKLAPGSREPIILSSAVFSGIIATLCLALCSPWAFACCAILPLFGLRSFDWGCAHVPSEAVRDPDERKNRTLLGESRQGNSWRAAGSLSASQLLLSGIMSYSTAIASGVGLLHPWKYACLLALAVLMALATGTILSTRARTVSLTLIFRISLPVLCIACLPVAFSLDMNGIVLALCAYAVGILEYGTFVLAVGWSSSTAFFDPDAISIPRISAYLVFALGLFVGTWLANAVDAMPAMMCEVLVLMITFVLCVPSREPHLANLLADGEGTMLELTEADRARYALTIIDHNLTAREAEVLVLLLKGCGAREIADTLSISRATANTHIHHIYEKYGVHSKEELEMATGSISGTAPSDSDRSSFSA
jgi:DNA-binding CsgD family transcriptional regulator